jgi:hypothetical protein
MSGSDDGDVVIVGMMVASSMESAVPGMLMSATAFVVVATDDRLRRRGARRVFVCAQQVQSCPAVTSLGGHPRLYSAPQQE